ncbi:MAG: Ppx/GppA family phosphatase [Acetilactobacillus jinshanensis]
MKRFGVIDLGSNSIHLIVTQIDDDGMTKTFVDDKVSARLSEGMMEHKKILQKPAMKRAIDALLKFKKDMPVLDNLKMRVLATAAVRMAKNQKEFCKSVKNETGFTVEVIPGEEEAYYDYLGVINSLPVINCVIIDAGGASTELVLVQNRRATHLLSLPIGGITLTERFLHSDKPTASDLFRLITFLNGIFDDVWWLNWGRNTPIIALGGSNRCLAKIWRRKDKIRKNWDKIHGFRMANVQIDQVFNQMLASNLEQRKKIPGLAKDRADIVVGGTAPLVYLLRYLDSTRVIFSKHGLRTGALHEYLHQLSQDKHDLNNQ